MSPGPFATLAIPASGMTTHRVWLDAVSDNIANINTVRPTDREAFRERQIVVSSGGPDPGVLPAGGTARDGRGVRVLGVVFGDPEGRLVWDPDHPLADADGLVRLPDIDLGDQMTKMILAQRAYQANVSAFERARDSYERILEAGR